MLKNIIRRRFQRSGGRPFRCLCLALGLFALTGCAERTSYWSPSLSPKKNRVSWAEYHHRVNFASASTTLDKAEKEALGRFLRRVGRGEGVRVMLDTGAANQSSLTRQRETSLARHLIDKGYSVSRVKSAHPYRGANSVRVTVGRYVVTLPSCPDWSKESMGDTANRVTSNWGCANETNLGLMVANPERLIRGGDLGPADGEAVAAGVKAYREGTNEELKTTSARDAVGGGGGSKK